MYAFEDIRRSSDGVRSELCDRTLLCFEVLAAVRSVSLTLSKQARNHTTSPSGLLAAELYLTESTRSNHT